MRCKTRTKSGKACAGQAVGGGAYCFTHDPSRASARARARKLGGKHRRKSSNAQPFPACDPKLAQGLSVFLESVMRGAWDLDIEPPLARTLGYLAAVQQKILQVGEIEDRLAALEAAVHVRPK